MAQKKQSFEEAMAKLDEIVERLSAGNLPLDEMMKLYEEGNALSKRCMEQLEAYQGKLESIAREQGDA